MAVAVRHLRGCASQRASQRRLGDASVKAVNLLRSRPGEPRPHKGRRVQEDKADQTRQNRGPGC